MSARTIAIVVAAAAALVAVIIGGGWLYGAGAVRTGLDDWANAQRAHGIDVRWQALSLAGFPLRLDARLTAPTAARTGAGAAWTWAGPTVGVRFFPLAPDRVTITAPGRHRFAIDDRRARTRFDATVAQADGRARMAADGLPALAIVDLADVVVASDDAGLAARAAAVRIAVERRAAAPGDDDAVRPHGPSVLARAEATGLSVERGLRGDVAALLGNEISRLHVDGRLLGPLDTADPDRAGALARWRDAGGTIEINRLELAWGTVELIADGTLALDHELQPEGAFSARLRGLTKLITALERARMIDPSTAALARITLAVLTRPADDGGPPVAKVPLTLQNRRLSAGPVPLLTLSRIRWR